MVLEGMCRVPGTFMIEVITKSYVVHLEEQVISAAVNQADEPWSRIPNHCTRSTALVSLGIFFINNPREY